MWKDLPLTARETGQSRPDWPGAAYLVLFPLELHHHGAAADHFSRAYPGQFSRVPKALERGIAGARLSANRMLVELIENGIEAEKRREKEFFALAERFQMGRMVFGA